jgi:glycosyltransferase involved in cell wall biosynthesis
MRLAFVDFVYHYDAARPEADEPLGGTTSAICFLAREMVKAGHACTIYNLTQTPADRHGVATRPLRDLGNALEAQAHDAYIFCGRWSKELVVLTRANTRAPLIAWMHESALQPPLTPALDEFDAVAYVSEWQQRVNAPAARPHWKQAVLRNAMNPAAAASFPSGAPVLAAKAAPPVFLFAGSFARGAFHIAPLLEKLRPRMQAVGMADFAVELFCNLDPSRDPAKDAAYIGWLRGLPNIAHVGMVGQTELAARMKRASVLLAPNPWPETSCIALIEGLASGLCAVATARAALPETASGFARLLPIDDADHQTRFDMPIDYDAFAAQAVAALAARTEEALRAQIDHFHAHYQWSQRVAPWVEFIESLSAK